MRTEPLPTSASMRSLLCLLLLTLVLSAATHAQIKEKELQNQCLKWFNRQTVPNYDSTLRQCLAAAQQYRRQLGRQLTRQVTGACIIKGFGLVDSGDQTRVDRSRLMAAVARNSGIAAGARRDIAAAVDNCDRKMRCVVDRCLAN